MNTLGKFGRGIKGIGKGIAKICLAILEFIGWLGHVIAGLTKIFD